jgi:hypothetical protein
VRAQVVDADDEVSFSAIVTGAGLTPPPLRTVEKAFFEAPVPPASAVKTLPKSLKTPAKIVTPIDRWT